MDNNVNVTPEAPAAAPAAKEGAPAAKEAREQRPFRPGKKRKKVCSFCAEKVEYIDFKDAIKLRKFVSERSKILPRRITGTCAKHQRELTLAIKRARHIALIPYISD